MRKIYRMNFLYILIIILLTINVSYSQTNKIDSLNNLLSTVISDTVKIQILNKLAFEYSPESIEKSREYLRLALNLSKEVSESKYYIETLLSASKIYRTVGKYEDAVNVAFMALNYADSLKLQTYIAQASKHLGINHYRLKNYDKALEFHNKALEIYITTKNILYEADCYINIGVVYDEKGDFDQAIDFYNKAFNIYEKENELSGMSDIYNNLAGIYYQKQEKDKVIEYINKSLEIKKQLNDKIGIAFTLINIGGVYNQFGNYEKAILSIEEGLDIAVQMNILPLVNQGYLTLLEITSKRSDYKKAYQYYGLYTKTKDSLFNIEKTKMIQELQTKYETAKKEERITLLEKDAQIKDIQISRNRILWISLLVILILLISFVYVLIKRNKLKTETNAILNDKNKQLKQLNNTQNRLLSIISHDFKAPLSAFYSITNSLKTKYKLLKSKDIEKYFNRMLNSSIALKLQLENMLNWAIYQTRDIKINIQQYNLLILTTKVVLILQEFANEKSITIENKIDENIEIKTCSTCLNIVVNNLIANAVKFSPKNSTIIVNGKQENNKILISIKDTGIGMNEESLQDLFTDNRKVEENENTGTGLGLIVSKEIVEKLGGKIWAESKVGEGSEFFVEL